ncbi:NADP-dependent oxidoreductase [Rossellomorea aquimaris]|uniref:NADP-dependent oxidoreductase n=1 Tax=Rossellomorea aquimaris TaxID=189382 RepID=A0A5D4U5N7_9BACI|nr:NADP-dependent oxidoreductase [Rossellomorea aquimaris]TYS76163.1 NADP-dependent oxidoreductase [Rossellomorea aquimaris]TYS82598.1 NADP-dependent oxidoreductase [Rossellomorea aquimaris]
MKAMTIKQYGKTIPLELTDLPIPDMGEQDVLVEIHAASINPIDFKIRDGKVKMLLSYKMPLVLGNDFSGKVIQTGSKVSKFQIGDEVYGRPRKNRIGTFAEYLSVHEDDVSLKPENLTFEEAASLPLVGLTSWQAFHEILQLKPDQKILIHAGAGGVGTFAIQLAKEMGVFVATTASEKGFDLVSSLGADRVINYREEKFEEILNEYDAVFDTLGGDVLDRSFRLLKPHGKIVSVSAVPNRRFAAENNLGFIKRLLFSVVSRNISALEKKFNVDYHFLFMKPSGEQLTKIKHLVEKGSIRPVIDRVYSLEEAQEAVQYVETGRAKGKVVIQVKKPI